MHSVQYLMAFSGICWTLVALYLAPNAWRALFGKARYLDPLLSAFFFMGVLQAGFVLRWMRWPSAIGQMIPDEMEFWTALYALCGLLGLWVLKVAGAYRGKQH